MGLIKNSSEAGVAGSDKILQLSLPNPKGLVIAPRLEFQKHRAFKVGSMSRIRAEKVFDLPVRWGPPRLTTTIGPTSYVIGSTILVVIGLIVVAKIPSANTVSTSAIPYINAAVSLPNGVYPRIPW